MSTVFNTHNCQTNGTEISQDIKQNPIYNLIRKTKHQMGINTVVAMGKTALKNCNFCTEGHRAHFR